MPGQRAGRRQATFATARGSGNIRYVLNCRGSAIREKSKSRCRRPARHGDRSANQVTWCAQLLIMTELLTAASAESHGRRFKLERRLKPARKTKISELTRLSLAIRFLRTLRNTAIRFSPVTA